MDGEQTNGAGVRYKNHNSVKSWTLLIEHEWVVHTETSYECAREGERFQSNQESSFAWNPFWLCEKRKSKIKSNRTLRPLIPEDNMNRR